MEIFESKKVKGVRSHINNLISIANSDGNFSIAEKRLIFAIGRRQGLSNEKLKEIIKSNEPIKFKVPSDDAARFDQVAELVEMLLADGTATENEIATCIEMAEKLGFRKAIVGVLVRKLVLGMQNGKSKEELRLECANFLCF